MRKHRKGSLVASGILRRLKNRTRFSRIRIQAEDQELGRQRAQIDDAALEWFWVIPFHIMLLAFIPGRFCKSLRRFEYEIDCLVHFVGQWLERDDAILSDRRRD